MLCSEELQGDISLCTTLPTSSMEHVDLNSSSWKFKPRV